MILIPSLTLFSFSAKRELSKNELPLGTRIGPTMSYKQASLFSFKAFLLGTTLCLSGSGILVLGISSALGVSSVSECEQNVAVSLSVGVIRLAIKN